MRLWRINKTLRGQKMVQAVRPYLTHSLYGLRIHAVWTLGASENPAATPILSELTADSSRRDGIARPPKDLLQLTLARIRSRNLKGKARVDAVARGMGSSWTGIVQMSHTATTRRVFPRPNRHEILILNEFVNLLGSMAKKGKNIKPLAQSLRLGAAQKVRLETFSLPPSAKVKRILDSLSENDVFNDPFFELNDAVLEEGRAGTDIVFARLNYMRQHSEIYGSSHYAYAYILRLAAQTGEERMFNLFRQIEAEPRVSAEVRREAVMARQKIRYVQGKAWG
jgi:hypothetical protein